MTLKEQINADIKTAMLAKDTVRRELLKFVKGEIQNNESRRDKDDKMIVMNDGDILILMKKQIDNLKATPTVTSEQEINILSAYLPQLMSEDEIRTVVTSLKESGASNLGAVMGHFSKNLKGKADNALVSKIAKEMLQ